LRQHIGTLLGKEFDLRIRKTGAVVEIVRVEGVGRLWDRTYMVVPADAPNDEQPVAATAGSLVVYDHEKGQEQSAYSHGRKLSDWLATFHERGLDGRGCFNMSNSGHGIGHYTTCGNPAKMKVDAVKNKDAMPMLAVPHGYKGNAYFCGTHDPLKRHQKRQAKQKAWDEKWKRQHEENARREREDKERRRRAGLYDELVAALAAITDGEGGDPRELARRALVTAGEIKPSP
jgi:hypothetical protein